MSDGLNKLRPEPTPKDAIGERLENYQEWIQFADVDLLSAQYLTDAPFYPRPLSNYDYSLKQTRYTVLLKEKRTRQSAQTTILFQHKNYPTS